MEMLDVMGSQTSSNHSEYEECRSTEHGYSQEKLNDLICELNISKTSTSRLKEK